MTQPYKKKLIEVALPLEAINREAAREKSIRHGHPSTLHLWWARRPLAACRAVLFASLVDDPSAHPDRFPTEEAQEVERQRLFRIIEELVKWENSNNERVLNAARAEIMRSCNGKPPPVYDPFCGGGSIPLEAQRLGLEAHGSDLNPVPVLITKALIEIPPKFSGKPPVNPEAKKKLSASGSWKGAAGLAEDIRYYGQWMRDEAEKRIGHLYPKVKLPKEHGGGEAMVIAWLWARTVASPNPAAKGTPVPLVRSFWLSTKAGKKSWVEPVVDQPTMTYRFEVRTGTPKDEAAIKDGTKSARGANFRCLLTGTAVTSDHIRAEGKAGRIGARLMAIVAERNGKRVFVAPDESHERTAQEAEPAWLPEQPLADDPRNIWCTIYGIDKFWKLFTARQLLALNTFCELVSEARVKLVRETGASAEYADAVATYLGFGVSRLSDICNALCRWETSKTQTRNLFGRQAIPMMWDFSEPNVFSETAGDFSTSLGNLLRVVENSPSGFEGHVRQASATELDLKQKFLFSTDPPYYDNISYANLSDFFYVWLRRCLTSVHPNLFGTMLPPKAEELIADPYRFAGDREKAKNFFEAGLAKVFLQFHEHQAAAFPVTVFYAFRQAEESEGEDEANGQTSTAQASTGWETFLAGLLDAGFSVDGTWPMRTELANKITMRTNILASSIVLVCRPRPKDAGVVSRRDFLTELKKELPEALRHLQKGNIAPVDLAQAAIGPGMAVFSRYARVLETDGSPMSVRTALALINQTLDEVLAEQEGEFDADTRWALAWFDQYGFNEGPYGAAETLCTAKNTSVPGMVAAGILIAKGGKVRLLKKEELPPDWNPATDERLTIWEITHHLIRRLEQGESGAADLIRQLGVKAEVARDLSYRLYTICERRKWATDAIAYNTLVLSWGDVQRLAAEKKPTTAPAQGELI